MGALPLLISGEVEGEGVDGGVGGTITGREPGESFDALTPPATPFIKQGLPLRNGFLTSGQREVNRVCPGETSEVGGGIPGSESGEYCDGTTPSTPLGLPLSNCLCFFIGGVEGEEVL
jgi:hypothetical protein